MVKKLGKIFFMVMFLITSIGPLAGCGADYGYAFHFYVDGGNGEISIETTPSFFGWLLCYT